MDERTLIWAAGVADGRMRIRVRERRKGVPSLEITLKGEGNVLKVWGRVMRLRTLPLEGPRTVLAVGWRDQGRVLAELRPFMVRGEEVGVALKLREMMWKRVKAGERAAMLQVWKEVERSG